MKKYFIGIYCPPQISHMDYPMRNTEAVFKLLKDAGIEHVFGHYEDKAGEDCLICSLAGAEKTGIKFYPRLDIFNSFLGIDGAVNHPSTSFNNLSDDEKDAVYSEFERMLSLCAKYSSFGGMFMGDERGYETFAGIGAAQRRFSSLYPDKLFMYNHLNYFIDDQLFFYSTVQIEGEKKRLSGNLSDDAENRFRRYEKFIGHYIENVNCEYISTDVYPFMPTWKDVPTSIHRSLYEVQSFFADIKEKTGLKPLTHIQLGNWTDNTRYIGKTEIALHMGIAASYNFDGFIFFPGCFPNDWLDANEGEEGYRKDGKTALIDAHGNPTVYYGDTKKLIAHFNTIGERLSNARWLGVCFAGEFIGGFAEEELTSIHWNECIYRGGLPENEKHAYLGELPEFLSESQVFIGVFEDKSRRKMFTIVNNSIVCSNKISINFANKYAMIFRKNVLKTIPESITLDPGETILLISK